MSRRRTKRRTRAPEPEDRDVPADWLAVLHAMGTDLPAVEWAARIRADGHEVGTRDVIRELRRARLYLPAVDVVASELCAHPGGITAAAMCGRVRMAMGTVRAALTQLIDEGHAVRYAHALPYTYAPLADTSRSG